MSKRTANAGSFKPGFDPRRHVFSRAERQKGFWVFMNFTKLPSRVRASVRKRIRRYYQQKKGTHP